MMTNSVHTAAVPVGTQSEIFKMLHHLWLKIIAHYEFVSDYFTTHIYNFEIMN